MNFLSFKGCSKIRVNMTHRISRWLAFSFLGKGKHFSFVRCRFLEALACAHVLTSYVPQTQNCAALNFRRTGRASVDNSTGLGVLSTWSSSTFFLNNGLNVLYTENNNFSRKRGNLVEQLSGFLAFDLTLIPYVVITLLVAFTVHEFAHAYVAYKFGDDTAKRQGRLTLNPIAHLDPFGTILIFLAGFGWARPVPVNRFHFKKPRLAGILVSVAGPLSNLLVAALALLIYIILIRVGVFAAMPGNLGEGFETFFNLFVRLNIVLFIFNLLPFPPLDGYRIIEDLVPARVRPKLTQYEGLGIVLFLVLVITPLGDRFLYPFLYNGVYSITGVLVAIFRPILQL